MQINLIGTPHMPSTIKIKPKPTIEEIEEHLLKLQASRTSTSLEIPYKCSHTQFGVSASLIQLILSWARHNETGHLKIHKKIGEDLDEYLRGWSKTDHGFVSLVPGVELLDLDNLEIPAAACQRSLEQRLELATRYFSTDHKPPGLGPKVYLVNHSGGSSPKFQYNPLLYDKDSKSLFGRSHTEHILRMALERTLGSSQYNQVGSRVFDSLPSAVFELLDNAHRWGRHDLMGLPIKPAVWGVLIESYPRSLGKEQLVSRLVADGSPVRDYLNELYSEPRSFDGMIEISVFDNGVGIAQSMLDRPIAPDDASSDEFDSVCKAFTKWTSRNMGASQGWGLNQVLHDLSEARGFFRLRTGRLSLYQDYSRHQGHSQHDSDAPSLNLASRLSTNQADYLSRVEGTLYTILAPLQIYPQ